MKSFLYRLFHLVHATKSCQTCVSFFLNQLTSNIWIEDRFLSPVAILANRIYLDLLNGPKDHSWCSGNRCGQRLSLFTPLVTYGSFYDIYLSSTPPQQLRFRLLDADAAYQVTLAMFYSTSQRVDVYKDNSLVAPVNAVFDDNRHIILGVDVGSNAFDRSLSQVFFVLGGGLWINISIYIQLTNTNSLNAQSTSIFSIPDQGVRKK